MNRIYAIKKIIKARSVKEAIAKENKAEITNVWIDELANNSDVQVGASAIGFEALGNEEYFDD